MTAGPLDATLRVPSVEDARRLHDFLVGAGYTEEGLLDALGTVEAPLPHLRNLPRLFELTSESTPLNILLRWFLLGVRVEAGQARGCLPGWFLELALACGLLRAEGDEIASTALVVPVGSLLIASDLYQRLRSDAEADHVLTISPAARLLAGFMIQRPIARTLDLCAGCGILAMAAAPHSAEVVATDLNPRAVVFAAFNTRLNGFENIRCLTGDCFEPVKGNLFDHIICNPPFILAPSARYLYRDSGMDLDGFCRRLVHEAPRYLDEGGCFQMIFDWAQLEGQSWQERLSEWFEGNGCDVWLIQLYRQAPSWYAQMRVRETYGSSLEDDAAEFSTWMRYYKERRVEAIHGGLVAMRRRSGSNWMKIEEVDTKPQGAFGEMIARGFEGRDFLEAHASDELLLAAKLRVAPEARLDQTCRLAEGGWRPASTKLCIDDGLPRAIGLDADVAEFLGRFDGRRALRDLILEMASAAGVSPDRAQAECLGFARLMIDRGVLLPATAGS